MTSPSTFPNTTSPEKSTELCSYCPKLCRSACPVSDADQTEATTPWGKMTVMKMVEEKKIPPTKASMQEALALAYKCLDCGASESACELDNSVAPTLMHYRKVAFREGWSPENIQRYCQSFRLHQNPYARDLIKPLKNLARTFPVSPVSYFSGCSEISRSPETVKNSLALLKNSGSEPIGLCSEISCCGYPLYAAGDWEGFTALAKKNLRELGRYRELIVGSPSCLWTMETLYPSLSPIKPSLGPIFSSLSERLVKQGASHRGRKRQKEKVAYHDPCYLGRHRKVYEEPRSLIQKLPGVELVEFSRNREKGHCSGGGGLLPISSPETAQKITENRIAEFKKTGADVLVTSCSVCVGRFKKCGKGLRVLSLADYLSKP